MAQNEIFNPNGFTTQYGFPAYRVFIFGQEVTCDVTSVTYNWHDGLEPPTCAITLADKNFRYTITHNDMVQIAVHRNVPRDQIEKIVDNSTPIALRIPTSQLLANSTGTYVAFNPIGADDVAHDPTGAFRSIKQNIVSQKLAAGGVNINAPLTSEEQALNDIGEWVVQGERPTDMPATAWRFPLQVGKPIFHAYDPVRVFERDPYDPTIWYYIFSGFCSDFTTSKDTNGDVTMTVVAEAPSKLLRYGRFTSNPGIVDVSKVAVRNAIVADVTTRTAFKNAFAHSTLPEIAYAMLFGVNAFGKPDGLTGPIDVNMSTRSTTVDTSSFNVSPMSQGIRQAAGLPLNTGGMIEKSPQNIETPDEIIETMWCANGSADVPRRKWGVGHIKLTGSKVFLYGPDGTGASGGTASDPNAGMPLALGPAKVITQLEEYQNYINHEVSVADYNTMRADGVITTKMEPPQPTNIWETMTVIGQRPDIYPVDGGRLIMLLPRSFGGQNSAVTSREFIQSFSLNTEWTTRQDVLAEIVERIEFVWYVSPKGDYIIEFPLYDFAPSDFGAYEADWDIPLPDTQRIDTTFTDSKVYTQAVTTPAIIQNFESTTEVGKQMGRLAAVTMWHLVPTFGVRQASLQPRGYLNTLAAARVYCHYSLNRLNADAFTQSTNITPNLNIWINRPVMINIIDHIGTVRSVTHNITWGEHGDMTTNMGLAYMRGWDGALDVGDPLNPKKVYYTIGGVMGRPLNYKLLFEPNPTVSQPLASGDATG